ncbi:uncharacterized protein TM35_000063310 [Trypanosoma theileri]|uniref:Uncharacterized protein n=1 Tax=Trypanosoma theileri TaxID=67003 RepID=A0A1X0P2Z5_9TRYP|nr:uncharacterized protein TM35_000063310 [Trypanosoma theileri]ORC91326.1 hypothetical protein TM35_000063310 [Trypanosoma theileri]
MNVNNIRQQDAASAPLSFSQQKDNNIKEIGISKEKSPAKQNKEQQDESFLDTINDDTNALRVRLKWAEMNNHVLTDNINTLKSVVNQLATQLDLANNQLALYTETEELQRLRRSVREENADNENKETLNTNEYNDRIASLHNAIRERDAMIMTLRHDMVMQNINADKLLRSELKEKDQVILRLMNKMEELQRIINAKRGI